LRPEFRLTNTSPLTFLGHLSSTARSHHLKTVSCRHCRQPVGTGGRFAPSLGDPCVWDVPSCTVAIPKKDGDERRLGIPTVSDSVAQTVAKLYLEPLVGALNQRALATADFYAKAWH
jgi:hypothetical protein